MTPEEIKAKAVKYAKKAECTDPMYENGLFYGYVSGYTQAISDLNIASKEPSSICTQCGSREKSKRNINLCDHCLTVAFYNK
jgi:hypothetical protein